jgi:hypothetical protein
MSKRLHVKHPLFCRILIKFEYFWTDFRKNLKYQVWSKSVQWDPWTRREEGERECLSTGTLTWVLSLFLSGPLDSLKLSTTAPVWTLSHSPFLMIQPPEVIYSLSDYLHVQKEDTIMQPWQLGRYNTEIRAGWTRNRNSTPERDKSLETRSAVLSSTNLPLHTTAVPPPGPKMMGHEADHSHSFNGQVRNEWGGTYVAPRMSLWPTQRPLYIFLYQTQRQHRQPIVTASINPPIKTSTTNWGPRQLNPYSDSLG